MTTFVMLVSETIWANVVVDTALIAIKITANRERTMRCDVVMANIGARVPALVQSGQRVKPLHKAQHDPARAGRFLLDFGHHD
ncbi:MAG: hypothetical protein ACREWJ_15135, partial [Rhodoferax sp.]